MYSYAEQRAALKVCKRERASERERAVVHAMLCSGMRESKLCSGMREGAVAPTKADVFAVGRGKRDASHRIFKSTPHLLFAAADLCSLPWLLEVRKPQNLLDAAAAEDSRRRTRRGTMRVRRTMLVRRTSL